MDLKMISIYRYILKYECYIKSYGWKNYPFQDSIFNDGKDNSYEHDHFFLNEGFYIKIKTNPGSTNGIVYVPDAICMKVRSKDNKFSTICGNIINQKELNES